MGLKKCGQESLVKTSGKKSVTEKTGYVKAFEHINVYSH